MTSSDRKTPADLGWDQPPRLTELWELATDPQAKVSFDRVVAAHDLPRTNPEDKAEALCLERVLRTRFEDQCGTIQDSYYCAGLRGGCALVERTVQVNGEELVQRRLHAVLDAPAHQLVPLESECVLLSNEANTEFVRPGRTHLLWIASDAVYVAMTAVLAAAELWADPDAVDDQRQAGLRVARVAVEQAAARVQAPIQRQARFIYLQGVLGGAVVSIAVCAALGMAAATYWSGVVSPSALMASTLFGALGAVVSVFQRIQAGRLLLDFNAPRFQVVVQGSMRPMVGAIFGAVLQFALVGGLFGATAINRSPGPVFGLFALIGFAAGFSERFATDMIERAGQAIVAPAAAAAAPAPDPAHAPPPVGQRPAQAPGTAAP